MDNEWGDFGVDGNSSGETDIFGESGGMELEPMNSGETQEINFGGNGFDTPAQTQTPQGNTDATNRKKVLIVSCIVCVVLLVVILFIWSISRDSKQQVDSGNASQVEVQQTQPQTQQVQTQQTTQQVQPQQTQKPTVQKETNSNQWVEVDLSEYLKDVKTEQGYFTVNSIKTLAMLKGNEKGNFLRAVLVGNITGMQGEYELIIPVTSVQKVSVGNVIDVEYSYINVKDSKIIVDIK